MTLIEFLLNHWAATPALVERLPVEAVTTGCRLGAALPARYAVVRVREIRSHANTSGGGCLTTARVVFDLVFDDYQAGAATAGALVDALHGLGGALADDEQLLSTECVRQSGDRYDPAARRWSWQIELIGRLWRHSRPAQL